MTTVTIAIMTTIVSKITMRALKPPLSTPTKVIRMMTKKATKTKTMKLLECADPSARTKGKQIGFLTMAY